jgi:hypothetical protein
MTKNHYLYLHTERLIIIIFTFLIFSSVSCGKSKKSENKKKRKPHKASSSQKRKIKKRFKTANHKPSSNPLPKSDSIKKSPSGLVLTELFNYDPQKSIPPKIKEAITLKEFADIILKETPQMSQKEFILIKDTILKNRDLNSGELGIMLYTAGDSKRISELGYTLITQSCIGKSNFFQPEKFFIAFAQLGFDAEPYLNEIIFNTKSDFIRIWAAELYVEIFYHNAEKTDGRFQKLAKIKDSEKEIMEKLKNIFAKPEKVKNILKTESIGRQIRKALGSENRYSLKILQILKLIDNMNKKNLFAVSKKLPEVIQKDSYNYNLFDYLDNQITKMPSIAPKVQLKYFTNAVFSDNVTDTYHWIPKENGGFSLNELTRAFKDNDSKKIVHMIKVFKEIISTVLKGKLLLGQGNRELKLLQNFYYSHWLKNRNRVKWSDSMIVIDNNTGATVYLVLQKKIKPQDILTGADILKKDKDIEDRSEKFLIPGFSSFVWFAPDGKFTLRSQEQLPDLNNIVKFKEREFVLSSSMHISIY